MGKVIAVVSGKGGTGKTTTTAAVASCLASLGHKTLAIDCDIGLRNLDIVLAMSDFTVTDISDVADGSASITADAHEHPQLPGLFFLTAPAYKSPADIDAAAFARLLDEARGEYEFTFIDAPAGIGAGFSLAAAHADEALIVSGGDTSSIRDAERARQTLEDLGISNIRMVINRITRSRLSQVRKTIDDLVDDVGVQLIGVIREDSTVPEAAAAEFPLVLYGGHAAARDFLAVARRIRGEDIPI